MTIKNEKGIVTYVMRTGATFVRSTMPLATAKSIMRRGKEVEETDKRGFGTEICVDDKYFFPVAPSKKQDEEKVNEVAE